MIPVDDSRIGLDAIFVGKIIQFEINNEDQIVETDTLIASWKQLLIV